MDAFNRLNKGIFLQGIQPSRDTKMSSHSEKDYILEKKLFKQFTATTAETSLDLRTLIFSVIYNNFQSFNWRGCKKQSSSQAVSL